MLSAVSREVLSSFDEEYARLRYCSDIDCVSTWEGRSTGLTGLNDDDDDDDDVWKSVLCLCGSGCRRLSMSADCLLAVAGQFDVMSTDDFSSSLTAPDSDVYVKSRGATLSASVEALSPLDDLHLNAELVCILLLLTADHSPLLSLTALLLLQFIILAMSMTPWWNYYYYCLHPFPGQPG